MSINWPKSGPGYVPAYQVSGIPFVTSSAANEISGPDLNTTSDEPIAVEFPFVTKYVTVRNTGPNNIRIGFSKRGIFAPGEFLPLSLGGAAKTTKSATDHRNYFLIPSSSASTKTNNPSNNAGAVITLDVRCKKLFFMADTPHNSPELIHSSSFSLIAGLTMIESSQFPSLTGSINGTGSFEGVG